MRLTDYLDKGASLNPEAPCLTMEGKSLSYREVQARSHQVARALVRSGVKPGDKVAILSANDSLSFACVFGIARAGAIWCPINPRNESKENRDVLESFDCVALLYQDHFASLVNEIRPQLTKLKTFVSFEQQFAEWTRGLPDGPFDVTPPDDVAMIVGTGGTTGKPKGVELTGFNLETMTSIVLMAYPFRGKPVYLALAPLTHAAGVLCFPIMTLGGEIVILPKPDLGAFLEAIERHGVTHTFMPPTLIYMLLAHAKLDATRKGSLQCFWYGAAPMSVERLEEALKRIGPMGQLFGQTEAPMMISTLSPAEHFLPDGSVAKARLSSAGKPAPLVTLAILADDGRILPPGQRGEIAVRSSLVMRGYYQNPEATAETGRFGWHHTGDIGFLDDDGYLFIVDRAKDMIITGGFNVYSAEVEQAIMQHPAIQDCAVVGMPDDKWGERVTAVVQLRAGQTVDLVELKAFVKARIGSVKAPKQVDVWKDLPRSKVGKVLKKEIRAELLKTVK